MKVLLGHKSNLTLPTVNLLLEHMANLMQDTLNLLVEHMANVMLYTLNLLLEHIADLMLDTLNLLLEDQANLMQGILGLLLQHTVTHRTTLGREGFSLHIFISHFKLQFCYFDDYNCTCPVDSAGGQDLRGSGYPAYGAGSLLNPFACL